MDLFVHKHSFDFHSATTDMKVYETAFNEPRVEISLILEGEIRFVVDGEARVVKAPAATFQAYRRTLEVSVPRDRRTRTMWCHFPSMNLAESEWDWLCDLPHHQPIPEGLTSLFAHALTLGNDGSGDANYNCQVRDALGAAIFAEYVRSAKNGTLEAPVPQSVLAAKRALDERYPRAWTLDEIAQIAGTNGNYLVHLFKKHVGEPPIRYLWQRRVDAGVHLLQTTRLPIDEIAYRCGFQTAAHFSRLVKRDCGRPPSLLRQSHSANTQWSAAA